MTDETQKPKFVFIRVNAAGYAGEAKSLICSFDPATDMLLVMKEVPYEDGERPGFLHVTTQVQDRHRDMLFGEDETRDAINAFYGLEGLRLVSLQGDVARLNPSNAIERDGMDESGMKFRFRDSIENGHYAVLIAAYVAQKQRDVRVMTDFFAEQVFTTFD